MHEEHPHSIEVRDLSYSYNGRLVLENINFDLEPGEYTGLIGPNGGGKTTLVKLILGLLKPQTGTIKIMGKELSEFQHKDLIGYVPQRASQELHEFPATVMEVVESGRTARKAVFARFNRYDHEAIKKAMVVANVWQFKDRLVGDLSGGERQRVFIARALAGEPKILILDEPSVGVDIAAQEQFYDFIKKLNKELKLTIIFISHDVDVVAAEVKHLLCLNKTLVCHGSPKQFLKPEYMDKLYGSGMQFVAHRH